MMRRYPEAKVVLTVRDPDRWYESARQTIYYVRHAFPRWMPIFFRRMKDFHSMLDRLVWDGMFEGRFEDRAFAIEVFNRYNEEVRRVVPPDRLLVYEVREGWEPLCGSSAYRSRRASHSPTSTTPPSSARGFSAAPGSCGRPAIPSSPSWP